MTAALRAQLAKWRFFEECLIHDLRPIRFGYGLDLVMNYVWDGEQIQRDAIAEPRLVTIRMLALETLHFVGGLTPSMKASPNLINWGLTEVAQITPATTDPPLLGISVCWEGERRIDAEFLGFDIFPTAGLG